LEARCGRRGTTTATATASGAGDGKFLQQIARGSTELQLAIEIGFGFLLTIGGGSHSGKYVRARSRKSSLFGNCRTVLLRALLMLVVVGAGLILVILGFMALLALPKTEHTNDLMGSLVHSRMTWNII